MRKKYTSNFKSKVAIDALKGKKTMAELSSEYEVHRDMVLRWKKISLNCISSLFSNKKNNNNDQELFDELYRQIGQQKVEIDWLKKKV